MPFPGVLDFKNPDYMAVLEWRAERLGRIRSSSNPATLSNLLAYYSKNPTDFIEDWGMTYDPRNVGTKIPAAMPFILFPRQKEMLLEIVDCWQNSEPLIIEKSRDVGASWLFVALGVSIGLTHTGANIGYGSRKEEYVDKNGSPKSLFYKARQYIMMLPKEFRGKYDPRRHAAHMRITLPTTGAVLTGEAGDNIGRGDRTTLYLVDESAHLARPMLVEAALSATTNCRVDASSVNGMNNPFAEKRHGGKHRVFTFRWQDDPRKDQAWYDKQVEKLDPIIVAQEIDLDYSASVEGVLIPKDWLNACLDAHALLGTGLTGERRGALDIADEGKDKNAFATGYGTTVTRLEEWSGKGSDIYDTVEKAIGLCDEEGIAEFDYDADGIGAAIRGDTRQINEKRKTAGVREVEAQPWRGSGAIVDPEAEVVEGRTNIDFFENAKAQGWWNIRTMALNTFRARQGLPGVDLSSCLSISTEIPRTLRDKLVTELSQVTYMKSKSGKMMINKKPDGTASPNLADAVVILYAPRDAGDVPFGIL